MANPSCSLPCAWPASERSDGPLGPQWGHNYRRNRRHHLEQITHTAREGDYRGGLRTLVALPGLWFDWWTTSLTIILAICHAISSWALTPRDRAHKDNAVNHRGWSLQSNLKNMPPGGAALWASDPGIIREYRVASPRQSFLGPISSWLEKILSLNERRGKNEWHMILIWAKKLNKLLMYWSVFWPSYSVAKCLAIYSRARKSTVGNNKLRFDVLFKLKGSGGWVVLK